MADRAMMFALLWFATGFLGLFHLAGYFLGWWSIGSGSVTWWLVLIGMLSMSVLETGHRVREWFA